MVYRDMQPKRALSLLRAGARRPTVRELSPSPLCAEANPARVKGRRRGNSQGWNGIAGAKFRDSLEVANSVESTYGGDAPRLLPAIALICESDPDSSRRGPREAACRVESTPASLRRLGIDR